MVTCPPHILCPNCRQTPSDLQLVVDVFLLQFGSLFPQTAVVPAGEHYHAVVAHSTAPRCHSHSGCRSHAVC